MTDERDVFRRIQIVPEGYLNAFMRLDKQDSIRINVVRMAIFPRIFSSDPSRSGVETGECSNLKNLPTCVLGS